ncbi:hypothetical protein E3T61_18490 [Cryobacterium lactosi]|uniref:Uncharacterized protein n=1 Tax=Cryobacterium lactosi TaxID=1259202 RepID=A0A4R9BHT9_9MICO|nr:hypothetical protein [Cryobacterium lactosi]TFD85009.1 hypothetical protein E3T61_18490 [Cryobacterium lactosi]
MSAVRSIKDLTSVIDCPVAGCEGLAFDHESDDPSQNLHRSTGPELEGVPMRIDYVVSAASWPLWTIDLDTFHEVDDISPMQASLMALHLSRAALRCVDMNDAASAAGWVSL